MKKLTHLILTLAVLLGLGWTLWIGVRKQVGKGEGSSALRFDNAEGT